MKITKEQLLALYETMFKIRRFEENHQSSSRIVSSPVRASLSGSGGGGHRCLFPSHAQGFHPQHAPWTWARDIQRGGCEANDGGAFRKKDGYCKGKGGSMHIADIDKGILGAKRHRRRRSADRDRGGPRLQEEKNGGVAICFFGDGATNRGTFHESINLAALWALPVIYVIENNYFGEFCPIEESCSVQKLSTRASAYGIPGITVDGNDVLAVRETAAKLI